MNGTEKTKYRSIEGPVRGHTGASEDERIEAVLHDEAELKEIEETLTRSEEKYRILVETMNEGLCVVDENRSLTFVNDKFCRMLGYAREELIGRSFTDFLDGDDLRVFEQEFEKRRKGARGAYKLTFTVKNSRRLETLVYAQPRFDAKGNFQSGVKIITDITRFKRAQGELRYLAEMYQENPYPVLRIRRDGKVLYANPAARSLSAHCGLKAGGCFAGELEKHFTEMKDSGSSRDMEVSAGDQVFSFHLVPVPGSDYLNIYGREVTEAKKLEEKLRLEPETASYQHAGRLEWPTTSTTC